MNIYDLASNLKYYLNNNSFRSNEDVKAYLFKNSSGFKTISFSHDISMRLSSLFCVIVDLSRVLTSFTLENDLSLEADVVGIVHKYLYTTKRFGNAATKL
jgi:hypothetical protein